MVAANKRVLVVDDEQVVRDSCERVLQDAGYVVDTVATGRDALAACRSKRFDVMLTDLRMPDMDGLEIARTMTREFPEIRVIVITGYPSHESARQAARIGVFDYLQKPVSPSRLAEATAEVLTHPPRFTSPRFPIPEVEPETVAAAAPEPTTRAAAAPADETPAPVSVAAEQPEATELEEPVEADISTLKALGLLAAAPLAGLALVVFLPLVGFGILFAAIGARLGLNVSWARK